MSTPRIRNLIRQADKVAESGRRSAAIGLYQQVLDEDSTAADAWVGLGKLLDDADVSRDAFQQALVIDPAHKGALNGLAVLDGKPIPHPPEPEIEVVEEKTVDPAVSELTTIPKNKPVESAPSVSKPTQKVEPNIGGVFPHPIDISEWVQSDGSMVSYKYGDPTHLRCNRCGRPISARDSKKTSVGYRCLICIYELEESYYEATTIDHIVAIAISTVLALVAGFIVSRIGRFGGIFIYFFIFAIGGGVGTFIARMTHRAIGRRRGRFLPTIVSGIVAFGAILPILTGLLLGTTSLFGILAPALYGFAAASAAYYFLK